MNKSDISRDYYMLKGPLAKKGYDWWWHNFTGYHKKTGEPKTFFIEYFVCNPAIGGDKAILGQLPENKEKGIRPSYAMIKVGCWGKNARQINNFYPISEFTYSNNQLDITIGNCSLTERHMKGSCGITPNQVCEHKEYMSDAGEMIWDIKIHKKIAYHVGYGASRLFRTLNAFEMFWHAEGIKTEYSGEVILDGEVYDIIANKSFGYADKNWGSDFTSPWLWISSCHMKSLISGKILNNSAVEFGGGRPKVMGVSLDRKLLGGLYYEGRMYDYNFSKFWTRSKIKFSFREGDQVNTWKLTALNKESILELTLECPVEEMLLINYEAPNGKKLHNRLWNGGTGFGTIRLYHRNGSEKTLVDHIEIKHVGCEYGEYL
ncbi:tocopherol cyclase family protein [Anaeromicropila herbilytica]|uniref:Tocopherol cyclase n=1 Tax=Anaeromicropila herbilytica TaxID=2785025 RepID=A0A7R7EIH6_9FIRM|nr:tocopherol cyclase family protein [Anaeromicropila herbilytica]BCN29296.1 hypothetical protein bsdtb5_05910 [Anaeromicropila herbilytica]